MINKLLTILFALIFPTLNCINKTEEINMSYGARTGALKTHFIVLHP